MKNVALIAALLVILFFWAYQDFRGYLEQEKQIADCSLILIAPYRDRKVYRCPNGFLYPVIGALRNAKGE